VAGVFTGAFAFGVGFDYGIDAFWDRWNRGVRSENCYLFASSLHFGLETMERYS
jgi:Ubiquinol-cytochrome C reductase, UQCRX/QCR9 like